MTDYVNGLVKQVEELTSKNHTLSEENGALQKKVSFMQGEINRLCEIVNYYYSQNDKGLFW